MIVHFFIMIHRKLSTFARIVLSALLLASCVSERRYVKPAPDVVAITLEGNITTGYSWEYTMQPEGIVTEVESEYQPAGAGRTGAGGTFTFRFQALNPGETEINFYYRRPWEKETAAASQATYRITIDADKVITATEER
jgi:inhibitor of cysteine peptidase